MIYLSIFKKYDWVLMGAMFFLVAAGLLSLASSSPQFFYRQLIWFGMGLVLIFGGGMVNWRWFIDKGWFRYGFYFFSVLLLVFVLLQPHTIRGTKSWIFIGGFQFEPAEIAKIAVILVLAGFFSRRHVQAWLGKNIFISLGYTMLPTALIALQPDLGSAFIVVMIWVSFLLLSGIHLKRFFLMMLVAVFVAVLMWLFFLEPYQKERILGFMSPDTDPLGRNYNVIQSKIAMGSAGFWGKGFGSGTQVQLKFLPEAQTDFIFAAFVEEWGVLGGVLVLSAFIVLITRIAALGLKARGNDMKFVVLGGCVVFLTHFLVNMGSSLGFLPVAGITFPFLSYGGSSLLTLSLLLGIIQHIQIESR